MAKKRDSNKSAQEPKYEGQGPFDFIPETTGRYMREFFGGPIVRNIDRFFGRNPKIDVMDDGRCIRVVADLPGISKGDIKLNVTRDSMEIRAEGRAEKEQQGKNYYYSERASSGYYRRVPLPTEINPKSAKAKFENGVLEVILDKMHPDESGSTSVRID
jgi:HSP20 family protein